MPGSTPASLHADPRDSFGIRPLNTLSCEASEAPFRLSRAPARAERRLAPIVSKLLGTAAMRGLSPKKAACGRGQPENKAAVAQTYCVLTWRGGAGGAAPRPPKNWRCRAELIVFSAPPDGPADTH